MSYYSFPAALAQADKFLWEVFLTDKWDHVFRNANPNHGVIHFPILPRYVPFCPTSRVYTEYERPKLPSIARDAFDTEKARGVSYSDSNKEKVSIVMVKDIIAKTELWCPGSILFNFPATDKFSGMMTSEILVWTR